MDVIMYLFLFFVVFFMTIFTFTAEKQINRVRCGISAFVLNIVFTVGWVSEVAGLIWHEGMDFFMHFGVPAIVISLIFAALCTAGRCAPQESCVKSALCRRKASLRNRI